MQKETRTHYLEAVNRAIEFIEANTSRNIGLEEIARYAFLSKYHFHRIFKSIIGNTTKDYLTRLRLEKSALMLKNSTKTINQIAYDCGYASPETFMRAFKSFFATTPTLFRESTQQEIVHKGILYNETSFETLNIAPPEIVEKASVHLAYIRQFGSYDKIDQSFQRLFLWATEHLPLQQVPETLGIVHDNLDLTEESNLRFDACIVVPQEIQASGEIGYKEVKGGKFAVFRYQGAFETFYPVYDYIYNVCLFEYKWELRDEPALEWYYSPQPFYGSQQLVTDFYLPII
ncbi:hypothetical protein BKI52_30395 [marine bacterium AO1-C]|nr:hypothetical protein BKI52_30395 [marine bacterium AO1-C]